jgi:ATP-dependent Clp protease ATP-binding subunit ClpA
MTTNAGAREITDAKIGFQNEATGSRGRGAIERTFSPEFRNRLDAWIAFDSLSFETIELVVDKFIDELRRQLSEKKVTIELTEPARAWLAKNGFDRQFGARPMARLIQSKIKQPLAEELLFGQTQAGWHVIIDELDNDLKLEFKEQSKIGPGAGKPELTSSTTH